MKDFLILQLTDSPPLRIDTGDWPIISHAEKGRDSYICVRRHVDGRTLVYGENDTKKGEYLTTKDKTVQLLWLLDMALGNLDLHEQVRDRLPVEDLT